MNITQVLVGQASVLTLTTRTDGDKEDQGTFTIGIVDAAGTEVVTAGTPATDSSDGTYKYTLAAQPNPRFLTVTWTEQGGSLTYTTYVEVVGGILFTEHQARQFNPEILGDENKQPDSKIADERQRITDWLEAHKGRSWVPRYRLLTFGGTDTPRLALTMPTSSVGGSGGEGAHRDIQQVLTATIGGVDVSDRVETDGIHLYLTSGVWSTATSRHNIVVEVVYGLPSVRLGVDRIALLELVDRLHASRIPPQAERYGDDLGSSSWEAQNNGRPSRVPEVNAWLRGGGAATIA